MKRGILLALLQLGTILLCHAESFVLKERLTSLIERQKLSFKTKEVAWEVDRREQRVMLSSQTTTDNALYQTRRLASFATFLAGLPIGALALILLGLARLADNVSNSSAADPEPMASKNNNISTEEGGSRTAILALWARSQAFRQGFGTDRYAPRLLQECLTSVVLPSQAIILQICAWLSRFNYRLTRGVFEDQVAWMLTLGSTGLVIPMHCRTCWLDDCVTAFVREHAETQANVIVLGSGYDSRCYRMPELQTQRTHCYEIDAPGTQAEKQKALANQGIVQQDTVVHVACDFETDDWFQTLTSTSSFDPCLPTLVLWEGVTMYLSKATICSTLQQIAARPDWTIALDYLTDDWTALVKAALKIVGEPFQFTPHDGGQVEQLLASCGLQSMEHLKTDSNELLERYVPQPVPGQFDGVLGTYGGFVLAGRK